MHDPFKTAEIRIRVKIRFIPIPIIAGPNRDRQFGHVDKVGPDHHGPESRWKKQARRRQRTKIPRSAPVAKDGG